MNPVYWQWFSRLFQSMYSVIFHWIILVFDAVFSPASYMQQFPNIVWIFWWFYGIEMSCNCTLRCDVHERPDYLLNHSLFLLVKNWGCLFYTQLSRYHVYEWTCLPVEWSNQVLTFPVFCCSSPSLFEMWESEKATVDKNKWSWWASALNILSLYCFISIEGKKD